VNVLVTGFTGVGVSLISQSLKQEKTEHDWNILSHELSKGDQLPANIDVGNFNPSLVIVVTDGTPKNVENSYDLAKLLKKQFPDAYKIAIAYTQNLSDRLPTEDIEHFLGLTTYDRE
jgi:hypothetical protein